MAEDVICYEIVRGVGDFFVSIPGPLPVEAGRIRLEGGDVCLHFGETVWRLTGFPADALDMLHQRGHLLCATFGQQGLLTAVEMALEVQDESA